MSWCNDLQEGVSEVQELRVGTQRFLVDSERATQVLHELDAIAGMSRFREQILRAQGL